MNIDIVNSFKLWIKEGYNAAFLVFAITIFAYFPELSQRTFNTDYYYESGTAIFPMSSFSADNRFLAEIIRYYIFHGYVAQFISLFVGLCLLCVAALRITHLFGVTRAIDKVIASLIITVNPLFLETFSYDNTCVTTPLAILTSVIACYACIGNRTAWKTVGAILLLICSLQLYQSAVFVFPILLTGLAILAIARGESTREILRIVAFGLMIFCIAMVLNKLVVIGVHHYSKEAGNRFGDLTQTVTSFKKLRKNLGKEIVAVWRFYNHDSFFFGKTGKILLESIYFGSFVFLVIRAFRTGGGWFKPLFLCVCFLLLPLIPSLPFSVFVEYTFFNFYRLMFPHAVVMCVTLILGIYAMQRVRIIILVMGSVFIGSAILYLNDEHQYMKLKNQYDMDLAKNIVDRLKANIQFKENSPLVIVGTNKSPFPFKHYFSLVECQTPGFFVSNCVSAFANDWSKDRIFMAYMPVITASESQKAKALEAAENRPIWPHPDSVFIDNGTMVVVLGRASRP